MRGTLSLTADGGLETGCGGGEQGMLAQKQPRNESPKAAEGLLPGRGPLYCVFCFLG